MTPLIHRVWRGTTAFLHHSRQLGWVDLLVLAGVAGAVVGLVSLVGEWTGPQRATVFSRLLRNPAPSATEIAEEVTLIGLFVFGTAMLLWWFSRALAV